MPPWVISAVSQALKHGLAGEILRGVGLGAAGLAGVVERGRLEHHQVRGLELHPAGGERMLDRLVLADRPVEHDALVGVGRGLAQRRAAEADALRRAIRMRSGFMPCRMYSKPLPSSPMRSATGTGSASMNSSLESTALAAHLRDLAHVDVAAVEVGVEQAQAVGAARDLLERRGAREDQHLVRDLRGRNPDLLARQDVVRRRRARPWSSA